MVKKKTRLRSTVNWLAVMLLITAAAILFVTSPFYARAILWGLNQIPVTVNQIAAASQQGIGALEQEQQFEPGSPQWLQQQAQSEHPSLVEQNVLKLYSTEQLAQHKNEIVTLEQLRQGYREIMEKPTPKPRITNKNNAHVIIVVGGGLAKDKYKNIFVNAYTEMRLRKAIEQKKNNPLPILLSGVESSYMQAWLKQHHVEAQLLENKSMNTCENTRFTSLLLQKRGGAPLVELITDAYHMPRTRRLFAMNGIDTIPIIAPLPNQPTAWQPDRKNLMHSRRATYEAIASIRDLWFGEINCREVP